MLHTAGDSFICVYADAAAALQSALAIQRALLAEPWPEAVAPLRVRMALHSGAASATPEGYVAEPTLNRLARVLAAGQGGQILLTQAVVDLIGTAWPDGITRRDLGVQQLRDVTVPIQLYQALAPDLPTDVPSLHTAPAAAPHADWGEAIDVPALYGREAELATLEQWVLADRCRVVALLGLGGIGKTSLALTLAQQLASRFDAVVFRSLRNAPRLGPLLDDLILVISAQQASPPADVPDKIAQLLQLVRARRCLIVLDNLETIIQAGGRAQEYRTGYGHYGTLIQRLGEAAHQSCLILTSREKPSEIGPLEGSAAPTRTLTLAGLSEDACQTLLADKDIYGKNSDRAALSRMYGGNPLALKLVSEPIRELFAGDVRTFLATGEAFFNGVGQLLEQQISRTTALEQALLYWLAIEREPATLDHLLADLAEAHPRGEILAALEALRHRSLIERVGRGARFTLQPVIMEYVTERLVGNVGQEIEAGQPALLRSHALVQATSKDYVRRSQERLIAKPLLEWLGVAGGDAAVERRLLAMLRAWHGQSVAAQGYGPGNVVNLLRLLRGDLRGLNLSALAIRQAYLPETEAQDMRLVGASLAESVLGEAFHYSLSIALGADGVALAAGTASGEVRLWQLADRTLLMCVQAHAGAVYGVALSADGQLIASSSVDGTVKLWEANSGACLGVFQGHTSIVETVALSPDGQLVASGGEDGTVQLWDTRNGHLLSALRGHNAAVYGVAISADKRLIVSAGQDTTIRLWDTDSSVCRAVLHGHTGGVMSVALSQDGRLVVSGSLDGTVRLWDADSGVCRAVLHGHVGVVRAVATSTDGCLVASGGEDGTVRLRAAPSGAALRALRPDRLYERMDITNLAGVTTAQRAALKALGAVIVDPGIWLLRKFSESDRSIAF